MKLPILISIPHAGTRVPPEVADRCILTPEQIERDGDEGAAEIYAIADSVERLVKAEVARAIVDLNRWPDDFSDDGVVKRHTCFLEPIYDRPLDAATIDVLLRRYYDPYHANLRRLAAKVRVGIDCHTMLAEAPAIGKDAGKPRPPACLSNGDGTCPEQWIQSLAVCLERALAQNVSINDPFRGGYITRSHAAEMPWIQLELSRAPFATNAEKREAVLAALRDWTRLWLAKED